jgi:translocation and assembly module TamB
MHLNKLFPADLNLSYQAQQLNITLDGKKHRIKDDFSYDINHSTLQNYLTLAGEDITLKGDINHLQLTAKIESLKTLQERLAPLYHFEKKPYDGALEINATITDTSQIEADIQSKWLVYEYSLNNFAFAEKVDLKLSQEGENLTLKSYSFNTYLDEDRRFFASKPSYFNLHQQKLSIESFWVNDQLRTFGAYDFQQQTGAFDTQTNQYHYKGKEGDITFRTSLQTTLDADKTHIQGNFHILKGLITYQSLNTHEIQSPDIIIIQEEKARLERAKESKSKLSLDITITSQQPLSYKVPKIDVALTPDIKIWKRPKKEVELLGRTTIHQGSYDEGNKHFDVLAGEILFGGDMHNPYLNIKAKHTNDPYVIDIDITGNLDAPIINFSANPYLSQSDILAMLLFSTTTESLFEGKKSSSSNQAITMLGNTFAKEIIKNFGLTLDRLVISTNEEGGLGIEVGKKVSQKITVIYSNDIVQSLKVRYQHSKHIETDIMISPESTGIDFIFKSEH